MFGTSSYKITDNCVSFFFVKIEKSSAGVHRKCLLDPNTELFQEENGLLVLLYCILTYFSLTLKELHEWW